MNTIGYIICETASTEPTSPKIINAVNDRVTIEANIQDMNKKNRNGRYYSDSELVPQINSPRINELLKSRNMFGEAGHPTSKDIARQQTIDPKNLSHLFHKIWVDKDNILSHLSAANTRVGDDFNRLILDKTKVSFSLRALGSVTNTSKGAEVKNIRIITWDWVVYPSHASAYMDKIVNESSSESNLLLVANENGLMVPLSNTQVTSYIKDQSKNVKSVIESFEFLYDKIVLNEQANKVTLHGKDGAVFSINLESHIQNEIMDYCNKKYRG